MKKLGKSFKLIIIMMTMLLLTGCVKYDMSMNITKEDVKISLIYAMESTYITDSTMFDDPKEELKNAGYNVEDYKDDKYTGIKASKSLGTLESLSKGTGEQVDITEILSNENSELDKSKLFKFEKGVYTANFVFDATEEETLSGDEEEYTDTEDDWDFDSEDSEDWSYDSEDDWDLDSEDEWNYDSEDDNMLNSEEDYSQMLSGIKFKFEVTLPNASISNNATKVSDDKKTLTWEVAYGDKVDVNFSFKLGNDLVIYIILGSVAIIAIGAVAVILIKSKNNKNKMTGSTVGVMPNQPVAPQPMQPQQPVEQNQVSQPTQVENVSNNNMNQ